jgi:hypothetical protein
MGDAVTLHGQLVLLTLAVSALCACGDATGAHELPGNGAHHEDQGSGDGDNSKGGDGDASEPGNDDDPSDSGGDSSESGDEGSDSSSDDADALLGPCSGSADECDAARVINEYRMQHIQQGECNNALRWDDTLAAFAREWCGPELMHSFGPYGESLGGGDDSGVRDMALFISEYDPPGEPHCNPDGSLTLSHHCNTMRCDAYTIGVAVVRMDGKLYMTLEFGGKDGASI